ncbi:hypothetical protein [Methylobacterium sp. J-077]|uniref:hypothetical protein n=1 Tax=Methylobacterium sp. J-077 TaxID=2836656 RepID=UPI001FB884E7|nr:hypothetical protein [Methylobacterium sp. J-077]MCJ2121100.1 hypothetical protein [Methylobacterium sp. J-077]
MDMPTPKGLDAMSDIHTQATLARVAQVLGCSPESFFEFAPVNAPRDTSQLIQIWLAVRSPKGREAIFAFAREILRSEK